MSTYNHPHQQSTVIKGRRLLINSFTDISNLEPVGEDTPVLVDFLLEHNYLSPTFFESIEEEA